MKKRLLLIVFALVIALAAAVFVACEDENTRYTVRLKYDSALGTAEVQDENGNARTTFKKYEKATIVFTPNEGYVTLAVRACGFKARPESLAEGKFTFEIIQGGDAIVEFGLERFSVATEYNDDGGTVRVRNEDDYDVTEFSKGDTVYVSVEPKSEYRTLSFAVNGAKKDLTDGKYSFEITRNTTISAAFGKPFSQDMLDSITGTFEAHGGYTCVEEGYGTSEYIVTTIFGTDSIYTEEIYLPKVERVFVGVYANVDGFLASVTHTIDNTIEYQMSPDSFYDYYNQFSTLTVDDFESVEIPGVYIISDLEKAKKIATPITGWTEPIKLFELTAEGNKITKIHIETADGASVGGVAYRSVYDFVLSKHGTAELEEGLVTPYKHGKEHDVLSAALMEMANAKNYTVSVIDAEIGYHDIVFDIYVTETAIYDDCEGYYCGWVLSDGKVYPFDRKPGEDPEITLSDPINVPGILAIRAGFVGYAPELFELVDDSADGKVFKLRDESVAGKVFAEFADGTDRMQYFGYAINGTILLDDRDKLLGVKFDTFYVGYSSTVTLLYSDVNSTVLPDYLDFSDVAHSSVFDAYLGTYKGEGHTVVITVEDGITIDGVITTLKSYSILEGIFTVDCDGEELYVGKKSARQLVVFNDDYSVYYELLLQGGESAVIPEELRGKWTGAFYDEESYKTEEVAYDEKTDTVSFTLDVIGEVTFSADGLDDAKYITVIMGGDEFVFERYGKYSVTGEIIPKKYYAVYTGAKPTGGEPIEYKLYVFGDLIELVVTTPYDSVALITDSTVEVDGVALDVLSYSADEGIVCYKVGITYNVKVVELDGETYLGIILSDVLDELKDFYFYDTREDVFIIPDAFIGTFTGNVGNDYLWRPVDYTLVITKFSITIQVAVNIDIVSDPKEATITAIEKDSSGYTVYFTFDGYAYELFEYYEGRLYVNSRGAGLGGALKRQEVEDPEPGPGPIEPDPDVEIPEEYYGDYSDEAWYFSLVIDEEGVSEVMINRTYPESVTVVSYDDTDGLTINVDGKIYYIKLIDGETKSITLKSADGTINEVLVAY
ncbi:MAG: hypothetical protein J1G38_01385 [Clostridiales bacterium]|nr:hypothetical protein [Clostridiales bacterium]